MIKLYSTGCPNCKVLTMKLDKKGIQYELHSDTEEMKALGLRTAPAIDVDGKIMFFNEAIKWVNAQ